MMKTTSISRLLLLTFLFILLFISACSAVDKGFPRIVEINTFPLYKFIDNSLKWYVLTPDGNEIYNSRGEKIDLTTASVIAKSDIYPTRTSSLTISPDGRYLTGVKAYLGDSGRFIIDLNQEIYKEYQTGSLAISWSTDSSRFLSSDWRTLVQVPSLTTLPDWKPNNDLYSVTHTSGYNQVLWNSDDNIPIALATYCPTHDDNWKVISDKCDIEPIISVRYKLSATNIIPLLTVPTQNTTIHSLFDPTGKYILFIVWERSKAVTTIEQDFDPKFVTDSVFYLIDWRTGNKVEWLRLSNFDKTKSVVSRIMQVFWSSDGSTILVPREDAEALVIKLKYP